MKTNYSEPVLECPSYCDDCDTWHRETLVWNADENGEYYTTCDVDGNHDPIDDEEAKELIESEGTWQDDYNQWVIDHDGEDPLGEYYAPRFQKDSCDIELSLTPWIGQDIHGLAFYELKTARILGQKHTTANWRKIPKDLFSYLELTPIIGNRAVTRWAKSHDEVVEYLKDSGLSVDKIGLHTVIKGHCEWEEPLPETEIRGYILRAALKYEQEKSQKQLKEKP